MIMRILDIRGGLRALALLAFSPNVMAGSLVQVQQAPSGERVRSNAVSGKALEAFRTSLSADDNFLRALHQAMRAADGGRLDGVAYFYSNDNSLDSNWLVQTPNVWGKRAGEVKRGTGAFVARDVQSLIEEAQHFVDITSLAPFPTGEFDVAVRHGLLSLAKSGRPVTVRILVGAPPNGPSQSQYLGELVGPLKGIRPGGLTIYAAAQRSSIKSWNHSKMVAVDGQQVLLGGENLWDSDYLQFQPVHDLNVLLHGSVAFGMHRFADRIWESVCNYTMRSWLSVYWKTGMSDIATGCLANSRVSRSTGPGSVAVLGAGRLAGLESNGDAADVAMVAALNGATSTIRIAQQDLGMAPLLYWAPGMTAIAKALVARQQVYIVISNDKAKAGPDGTPYHTAAGVRNTASTIKSYVSKQPGAPSGNALIDLLCSNLHLTTLRFGPSDHWPNTFEFANHAKFFMVDDRVFYVGSENLYPSDLVEYGVFISDAGAVRAMREQYWDRLWQYSSRASISGSEASSCYFRE